MEEEQKVDKTVEIVQVPFRVSRSAKLKANPELKKLATQLIGQDKAILFKGVSSESELETIFIKCLSIGENEKPSNNQLMLFLLFGYLNLSEWEPIISENNEVSGKITSDYLYSRLALGNCEKVNVFIYHGNFKAFKHFDGIEDFKYRLHFYQIFLGMWGRSHNMRTWISPFNTIQRPKRGNTVGEYKWYLECAWGSEALRKVLKKEFRDKLTYQEALQQKGKELEIYNK